MFEQPQKIPYNEKGGTKEEALRKCYDWFESDRNAKLPIIEEWEEMYKLYRGAHWDLTGPGGHALRTEEQKLTRPNAVENVTFALVEGLIAEFSEEIDIIDYPVESSDDSAARKMTEIKEFIAYKNRLLSERKKWNRNFFLYGTGIWHTFWDPFWTGGRGPNRWVGDVRWMAIHPQTVFPDARCRETIEEGRRIHKAYYRTQEEIKEKFGVDVEADMIRDDMMIGYDPEIMGGTDVMADPGEEQVLYVETWYIGEPLITDEMLEGNLEDDEITGDAEEAEEGLEPAPKQAEEEMAEGEDVEDPGEILSPVGQNENLGVGLHVIWWAGDGSPVYLKHANYVYYEPGETPKFPFHFKGRYERENSVWGFGEPFFLKSPQVVLNKTTEMILEGHIHHALGQTVYDEASVTPKQKEMIENYGNMPGRWFAMKNILGMRRERGEGVPPSLQAEPGRLQKTMETIVGRFDISQGRTPGSVTAFRALDLLAARAQVRLRSAEKAMTTSHEDCGNYVNHLVEKNYTEDRAYRILGDETGREELVLKNLQTGEMVPYEYGQQIPGPEWVVDMEKQDGPKYGMFNAEEFKKVYVFDSGEVYPYDEFAPGEQMVEGIDYEVYSPEFDVVCKVSSAMPTDRMFYMEIAKELYASQLLDEETFWFILKYGKLPPFDELIEKAKEKAEMQKQMLEMEQQGQGGGEGAPGMGQQDPDALMAEIQAVLEANPELAQQFMGLPPEQQTEAIAEIMQGG